MTTLTRAAIMALTAGRETDAAVLTHVYLVSIRDGSHGKDMKARSVCLECRERWEAGAYGVHSHELVPLPFSTDHTAVYEAETEIERRGLHHDYTWELVRLIHWSNAPLQGWMVWHIRHVDPLDCCKALLLCVMGTDMNKRTYVIAGNHAQFRQWQHSVHAVISRVEATYISHPEQLRGLDAQRIRFVLTGTWWESIVIKDDHYQTLRARGAEEVREEI